MSTTVEKPQAANLQQILVLLDRQEKVRRFNNFRAARPTQTEDGCRPSYMSEVMLPLAQKTENALPGSNTLLGKMLNGLFGVYDFTSSFKQDLCRGRITNATAVAGAKLIAKSAAAVFSAQVVFISGLAGLITSGPFGLAIAIGAGGIILTSGSYLAGKMVDLAAGAYRQVMNATKNYIQEHR